MKQLLKVAALALALVMVVVVHADVAAAGPDENRVWVKFDPNAKAQVVNALRRAGGQIHLEFDELGAVAVSLPPQALEGIRRNPHVEYVEPDMVRVPMAQVVPFGIDMVQARAAWDVGATGEGVTVCVIDSGLHTGHEDFAGVTVRGGHPSGWNIDGCGHGTHVAGTIAAANNATGVVGVSPGAVDLYILKVFGNSTYGNCNWTYSSSLVDAANRCEAAGARIINMSLGGTGSSTTERNAFQRLYDRGVLSIAAAGNGGNTRMSYPASYDSVISVAAIDANKQQASFSQRNSQVELAAPGVDTLSTLPFTSGSFAVAGSSYLVENLSGSPALQRTGALADGGRCTSAQSGQFTGQVVLCERGDISFADKVLNVQASGGVGVAIYNNESGSFSGTLNGVSTSIPSVSMARADGLALRSSALGQNAQIDTRWQFPGNGYGSYNGTSMATPHVAGVAALVWSANPSLSAAELRNILAETAEDLGPRGRDARYGFGLVQAYAAVVAAVGDIDDEDPGPGDPNDPTDPGDPPDLVAVSTTSVALSIARRGRNYNTSANVLVSQGAVTVSGCFSGAVSGCAAGTANANGQISFNSGNYSTVGPVTFCVTDISGDGVVFAPGANDCQTASP